MTRTTTVTVLTVAALAAAAALFALGRASAPIAGSFPVDEPGALPERVAWAWERPEDLSFLDPEREAVAALAATVTIDDAEVAVRQRLQPLELPRGVALVAVTRIEVAAGAPLDAERRRAVVEAVAATAEEPGVAVAGVQVDFDARLSERAFYADLLRDLRRRLGDLPISITALASWCLGDRWLDRAFGDRPPFDDAVPMLFRMGADDRAVRAHLAGGGDFASPLCRRSLGLATDEPLPRRPAGRRLYLFHPSPWSAAAWTAATAGIAPSPEDPP